eukprot:5751671-Alexandrium_andersonii.AAC.1
MQGLPSGKQCAMAQDVLLVPWMFAREATARAPQVRPKRRARGSESMRAAASEWVRTGALHECRKR